VSLNETFAHFMPKNVTNKQKNLLSNLGDLPIVRPNAPFLGALVNCFSPFQNALKNEST
jgi:hypothetical protein